jgi:hypothetical protein
MALLLLGVRAAHSTRVTRNVVSGVPN